MTHKIVFYTDLTGENRARPQEEFERFFADFKPVQVFYTERYGVQLSRRLIGTLDDYRYTADFITCMVLAAAMVAGAGADSAAYDDRVWIISGLGTLTARNLFARAADASPDASRQIGLANLHHNSTPADLPAKFRSVPIALRQLTSVYTLVVHHHHAVLTSPEMQTLDNRFEDAVTLAERQGCVVPKERLDAARLLFRLAQRKQVLTLASPEEGTTPSPTVA